MWAGKQTGSGLHCSTSDRKLTSEVERVSGIEPPPSAWKAEVLPLNYTRLFFAYLIRIGGGGRIRTYEGINQQIYSLPPLAAWVPLRGHKPAIVWSDGRSVNGRHAIFLQLCTSRPRVVWQSQEIRLSFGQTATGYQPRDVLATLPGSDRLLVAARTGRNLELIHAFEEPPETLVAPLIVRRHALGGMVEHARQCSLKRLQARKSAYEWVIRRRRHRS